MFTGIIEHQGIIESLGLSSEGGRITIHAPTVAPSLAVSNSIAVNGCCLTIVDLHNGRLSADLSGETIRKTSFGAKGGELKKGTRVNLEQPLTAGKEFGGHFVLGHVDTVSRVAHLTPEGENWWFGVQVPAEFTRYVARRDQRKKDARKGDRKRDPARKPDSQFPPGNENRLRIFASVRSASELDRRCVHIKKRNEVQDDGDVHQPLISSARRFVDLAEQQNDPRHRGLHDDGYVGSSPSWVDFSERGRQISVDAHDKGNPRDPRHRASNAAGIAHG